MVLNAFNRESLNAKEKTMKDTLSDLAKDLSGQKIRFYIDVAQNFGHQSNTINLLKRMINLGFCKSGMVDLIIWEQEINTIKVLLPNFDEKSKTYTLDSCELNIFIIEKFADFDNITDQAVLCICGGSDAPADSLPDLCGKYVKTKYYLQIQPFRWETIYSVKTKKELKSDSLIYYTDNTGRYEIIPFSQLDSYFIQRAFITKPPEEPNGEMWSAWKGIVRRKAFFEGLQHLISIINQESSNCWFFPVYGLYVPQKNVWTPVNRKPEHMLCQLIGSMAYAQRFYNKHIIIGVISELPEDVWQNINDTFPEEGQQLTKENDELDKKVTQWCAANGLTKDRIIILREADLNIDNLNKHLNDTSKMKVIVISIPHLPMVLFDYLYYIASLPSVFEGQSTANLLMNLGKPYFKLAEDSEFLINYPILEAFSQDMYMSLCNTLRWILDGYGKPGDTNNELSPVDIAKTVQNIYLPDSTFKLYFENLKNFYAKDVNDKLINALYCLKTKVINMQAPIQLSQLSWNRQETPLAKLYDNLKQATKSGILNLIPGAIRKGKLVDYLSAIIGSHNLTIGTQSKPVIIDYTPVKITVLGVSKEFIDTEAVTTFEFTLAPDGVSIDSKMTLALGKYSLAGAAWFNLDNCSLSVIIPGVNGFITGEMNFTLSIGGQPVDFYIDFPTMDGDSITLKGDLSQNSPSLSALFQLLGGVDFVSSFPAPLNVVTNLALRSMEIGYNYSEKSVTSFQVELHNSNKWNLLGKLALDELDMSIAITGPKYGGSISWAASTTALIGKTGKIDVGISYPNTRITARLSDDSPPIPVGDLLTFFLRDASIDLHADLANFSMLLIPQNDNVPVSYHVSAGIALEQWDISIANMKFGLKDILFEIRDNGSGPTGYIKAVTELFADQPEIKVLIGLSAEHRQNSKWIFSGRQYENAFKVKDIIATYIGQSWWMEGMPNVDIYDLEFTVETAGHTGNDDSAYSLGGTVKVWNTPLGDAFTSTITGKFGYGEINTGSNTLSDCHILPEIIDDPIDNFLISNPPRGYHGDISANIRWHGIDVTVFYNFDPQHHCYGIRWGIFKGFIEDKVIDGKKHQIATLTFTQSTTLGSMIETMVSWATGSKFGLTSPWNILDKIPLSNFALKWDFTDNQVTLAVNIGPIDLGLATIKSIGLTYQPDPQDSSKKSVYIDLDASFIWGEPIPAWDITKPETAPSSQGNGSKYLDLRLLAMGQHVTFDGFKDALTVQKAIDLMTDMPEPTADKVPAVSFAEDNSWLFGVDFGLMRQDSPKGYNEPASPQYLITLQAIFNDPALYALRVALAGDGAKIFKGLDFQIMYRKLNDNLGVYQAELTLPDIMRYLTIGAYSVTLPVFGIEVYTNGDFKVDIGFPWNENFARSFSVEAIVPPGIPLLGSGGFYFGKLPQVAVPGLPVTELGNFSPILVFGFGAQLGLGKSIRYGLLKAGFSLTMFGILEGILAKWNPYDGQSVGGEVSQLQGDYFFSLTGTFGLIGKIFGSVDFAVVKADVNITVKVYAQITLASYQPIPITLVASLQAKASLTINMGLFKIHLHFSFSVKVKETFVIGALQDPNQAPWVKKKALDTNRMADHLTARLSYHLRTINGRSDNNLAPDWSRFKKLTDLVPLEGYAAFALTVAGDRAFDQTPIDKSRQQVCFIANLLIKSVPAARENDDLSQKKSEGMISDTSFESLAKLILRWAIAAIKPSQPEDFKGTPVDYIDGLRISGQELADFLDWFDKNKINPIPMTAIEKFLNEHIKLTVALPSAEGDEAAAFFPMALPLIIEREAYSDVSSLRYAFKDYNSIKDGFLEALSDYFNQLAVQVQKEMPQQYNCYLTADNENVSVASFIFSDYFLLILKQMLQALRDGLRTFKQPIKEKINEGEEGKSCQDFIDYVNRNEQGQVMFGLYDLFEGNAQAKLNKDCSLKLPYLAYTVKDQDTLTSITGQYSSSFDAQQLAALNQDVSDIFTPGQKITCPDKPDYNVNGKMTLKTIATVIFQVKLEELLANNQSNILSAALNPNAVIMLPPVNYQTQDGDTLSSIAAAHSIKIADIAGIDRPNAPKNPVEKDNASIKDLFYSGSNTDYINLLHLEQFTVGELIKEAQRSKAIEHISAMVSRYYFHGLRMTTDHITPNYKGIWVSEDKAGNLSLPAEAGLFALTGQQILIPELTDQPFVLTLTKPDSGLEWLGFEKGQKNLTYTVSQPKNPHNLDMQQDADYLRIQALKKYTESQPLTIDLDFMGTRNMVETVHSSYPLAASLPLKSVLDNPPFTKDSQLRLWYLPGGMKSLVRLNQKVPAYPAFNLESHRYDQASGATSIASLSHWAWATALEFKIKKLPNASFKGSYSNTYEIMGVDGENALLLERMVQEIRDDDCMTLLALGYNTGTGAQSPVLSIEAGPHITMGISQVNLSTTTKPPQLGWNNELSDETVQKLTLLNTPTEFVELLWEAGITRAGGFYLYYLDQNHPENSIPDANFNENGETIVTLLVLFQQPGVFRSYMNAVLTGDPLELANSTVVAKAMGTTVAYELNTDDSLRSMAERYYTDVVSIVNNIMEKEPDIRLSNGVRITIENGTYQYNKPVPGGKLNDIAQFYHVQSKDIIKINPNIAPEQWDKGLNPNTIIRLPQIDLTVGSPDGPIKDNSMVHIADFYGCSVFSVAGSNQDVAGLLRAEAVEIGMGPFNQIQADIPGTQAIGATRKPLPDIIDDPTQKDYASSYLQHLYTMLGYTVIDNQDFAKSNMGLPLGPIGQSYAENNDKIRYVRLDDNPQLEYQTTISYQNIFKNSSPKDINPYLFNGKLLQLKYAWQDIYGNLMVPNPDDPNQEYYHTTKLIGYTDKLLGIPQWPAVAACWSVDSASTAEDFKLKTTISFDDSNYHDPASDQNAAALSVYRRLLLQLEDPNGIGLYFKTSLLNQELDVSNQLDSIRGWVKSIIDYLQKPQLDKGISSLDISALVHKSELNTSQLIKLEFAWIIRRTGGIVDDSYMGIYGIREVAALIAPVAATSKTGNSSSLKAFADQIKAVLSSPTCTITVGIGEDRYATASESGKTLWLVKIGKNAGQGIYFSKKDEQNTKPQIYARRPYSTKLINQTVTVRDFTGRNDYQYADDELTGMERNLALSNIDLDNWLQRLFASLDNIFAPQYISSILLVDKEVDTHPGNVKSFMDEYKNIKQALARSVSSLLCPVYKDQPVNHLDAVREALYQELLVKLTNLYSVRAAVAFGMKVSADIPEKNPQVPRLYGNIGWNNPAETAGQVVFTSTKLRLKTDTDAPLAFLAEFPPLLKTDGSGVLGDIECNLYYIGSNIEHQIAGIEGIDNYQASTWISFADSDTLTANWKVDLGKFNIPVIIQSFPESPSMVVQKAASEDQGLDLTDWQYAFTYSQNYCYPQDVVYVQVTYNTKDGFRNLLLNDTSVIQLLAQFINNQDALEKLLADTITKVTTASQPAQVKDAAIALGAYLKTIKEVSDHLSIDSSEYSGGWSVQANGDEIAERVYHLTIHEGEEEIPIHKNDPAGIKCWVVRIELDEGAGLEASDYPYLSLDGYSPRLFEHTDNSLAYWYVKDGTQDQPLTGADAQSRKERTLVMPATPIIKFQNANASLYIRRNEMDKIRDEFIYQTPEVTFSNPCLPRIDRLDDIDIAKIKTGATIKQALSQHLGDLFTVVFNNTDGNYLIQIECKYRHSGDKAADSINLPMFYMPPADFAAQKDSYSKNLLVLKMADTIIKWFNTYNPSQEKAKLCFDLTVLSNLYVDPMPMLMLKSLVLNISDITDLVGPKP